MKDIKGTLLQLREIIEEALEQAEEDGPPFATAPFPPLPEKSEYQGQHGDTNTEGMEEEVSNGRLAVVVGHSATAPGAWGVEPVGQSEYTWNSELARMIQKESRSRGHICEVFLRDRIGISGAYAEAEAIDPDAVVELHFNAANRMACGTETLRGSQPEALEWAQCVHDAMVAVFNRTGIYDRGIKRLKPGDRGYKSVSMMESVPSVLIEPFFGDSETDAQQGSAKKQELARAMAESFSRFMQHDTDPGRPGGGHMNNAAAEVRSVRLTDPLRLKMGAAIVQFEARRDSAGKIAVYHLPRTDGGGTFEVAGINDRYHPEKARRLRGLISKRRYSEAESEAAAYIADYTDHVSGWVKDPGVEFFLRDCAFNRGPSGAARILQLALQVSVDGRVGCETTNAARSAEQERGQFLYMLRKSRELYELKYIGRREVFWKGLENRWNKAYEEARDFPELYAASSTLPVGTVEA